MTQNTLKRKQKGEKITFHGTANYKDTSQQCNTSVYIDKRLQHSVWKHAADDCSFRGHFLFNYA